MKGMIINMGIIIDVALVLIIGLCIFLGYKRGLAKCLIKVCTSIIALILAITLYKPLVNFVVNSTTIDENIQLSLERVLKNGMEDDKDNNTQIVKEDSGIPKPIANYLNNNAKNVVEEKKDEVIVSTARSATLLIVDIACVIAVYLIAKIVLQIFTILVDIVAKLPVIKQFNELGGLIYGVFEGVLIIFIVFTLIAVFAPLTGSYILPNAIMESHIGSIFYNNNIFLNIIF